MGKKLVLTAVWFQVSIILIINSLIFLARYSSSKNSQITEVKPLNIFFADYLNENETITHTGQILIANIMAGDARALLLKKFLSGSPLEPYSEQIVSEADTYGIDYRYVPAIAMCESNLGKRIPSSDSYNAWGISVYTGQQSGAKFSNWETAISWVTEYIKTKYYDKGLSTPKKIGAVWAPPSVETGHSWAFCVQSFIDDIK